MEANVTRLQAEEDLRRLSVSNAIHSTEALDALRNRLVREMGTVVVAEPKFDREGLQRLKGKLKMKPRPK